MPRRNPSRRPPERPSPTAPPAPDSTRPGSATIEADAGFEERLARLGERLRRVALGLTAALIVARSYWPGESQGEADSGQSLVWVLAMLAATALAILGSFFAGRVRLRLSRADAAVVAMFFLVALSARQGAEGRIAINLAWEWVGVGLAYLLLRNLPRTDGETRALAGVVAATAVALAVFGLYQVGVIQPETQAMYRRDPEAALRAAGVSDDPVSRQRFQDRLLGSKEPTSTFALANSLAGVLVGPAVLALAAGLATLRGSKGEGRIVAVVTALLGILPLLACLLLTKSRSAYLGLIVGVLVLGWGLRSRVSRRAAIGTVIGGMVLIGALVAAGLASGQLDRQVLTESTKSFRFRWEYWVGTWGVITDGASRWWTGYGPGNFSGPYLRHRLPQASEAISDPHNFLLEVWATAGLPALIALLAALGLGLWSVLGPSRPDPLASDREAEGEARVPPRAGWLLPTAGIGGLLLAMALRPELSPLSGDLMRWVILAGGWGWAVLMGLPLWSRGILPAAGFGAGALAVAVNLLAAGGIGYAPVALSLWGFLALGQNLREDRPAGRLRTIGGPWSLAGQGTVFGLAATWAAVAGAFAGTVRPHWAAEVAMGEADRRLNEARAAYANALRLLPREMPPAERSEFAYDRARPSYLQAQEALIRATVADRLASRPWVARALFEFEVWRAEGEPVRPDTLVWHRVDSALGKAAEPPRNPDALGVQSMRAQLASELLRKDDWPEFEERKIHADRLESLRASVRLNPTEANLRAALSDALAEGGRSSEAVDQAREALRLHRLTPHDEKRLPPEVRRRLEDRVGESTNGGESSG